MTRSRSLIASTLIIGLIASGVAFAQGRGRGPSRGGGPADRGLRGLLGPIGGPALPLGALNLSDAQRQQVRDIRERNRDESRAAADTLRQALTAQRTAVEKVPVDEGLIRSTTQILADAQTEVALHQARLHAEVWGVLTPAQQDEAKKLRAEREARVQQRRQRWQERLRNQV